MTNELMLGRDVEPDEIGDLSAIHLSETVGVTFETSELQALCPAVVGVQPDIYKCTISFRGNVAIESKSLKLWLTTFRDRRIFAEHLAIEIGDRIKQFVLDVGAQVTEIKVRLVQNMRGGIVETVEYSPNN